MKNKICIVLLQFFFFTVISCSSQEQNQVIADKTQQIESDETYVWYDTIQEKELYFPSPNGRYQLECLDMDEEFMMSGLYEYNKVHVRDLESREIVWELEIKIWPPSALWSGDSRFLAYTIHGRFTFYHADTESGEIIQIF